MRRYEVIFEPFGLKGMEPAGRPVKKGAGNYGA